MPIARVTFVCGFVLFLSACGDARRPAEGGAAPVVGGRTTEPAVEAPILEAEPPLLPVGVGVDVVEVEPVIADRVYLYEPGYPPGCYVVGDWYYYGGQRYSRDVFIDRVVDVNVRENRYTNVTENERISRERQAADRREYTHVPDPTMIKNAHVPDPTTIKNAHVPDPTTIKNRTQYASPTTRNEHPAQMRNSAHPRITNRPGGQPPPKPQQK